MCQTFVNGYGGDGEEVELSEDVSIKCYVLAYSYVFGDSGTTWGPFRVIEGLSHAWMLWCSSGLGVLVRI